MQQISYRLDDDRERKLKAVFNFYNLTSDTASENHKALIDILYMLTTNHKNSVTIAERQCDSAANTQLIPCNCRIVVPKWLKAYEKKTVHYKDGSTADIMAPTYILQDTFYCVQWDRGKLRRQMKLESTDTCEICKLLTEEYLREQEAQRQSFEEEAREATVEPPKQPVIIAAPTPAPEPVQPTKPAPRTEKRVINSWACPRMRNGEGVHYSVCLDDCKVERKAVYMECIMTHSDIALNLAHWQRQRDQNAPKFCN